MKKLFTVFFAFAVILSMSVLSSCGSNSADVEKIIEKYDANEQLTEADYSVLLDYMSAAIDDLTPIFEKIKKISEAGNGDLDELMDMQKEVVALADKYPYIDAVINIFERGDDDEIGEANKQQAEKLSEKILSWGL